MFALWTKKQCAILIETHPLIPNARTAFSLCRATTGGEEALDWHRQLALPENSQSVQGFRGQLANESPSGFLERLLET